MDIINTIFHTLIAAGVIKLAMQPLHDQKKETIVMEILKKRGIDGCEPSYEGSCPRCGAIIEFDNKPPDSYLCTECKKCALNIKETFNANVLING